MSLQPEHVISNGIIVDGTGAPAYRGGVAVADGKILAVGELPLERFPKEIVYDAEGRYVTPGFIDVHSHSDHYLLVNGLAESKIRQGVTTEICGNCGAGPGPWYGECRERWAGEFLQDFGMETTWSSFGEFLETLEKSGASVNFCSFVGHNTIRSSVIGYDSRPASTEELSRMESEVREAMEAGAMGLSTGLAYPPGSYVGAEEAVALARAAVERGGLYATHMRDEGDGLLEAIEEALAICRESGAQCQISHLKTFGRKNWSKFEAAAELIEMAIDEGMSVAVDRYPYTAGCTSLDMALPRWALEGGNPRILDRLKNAETWGRIRKELIALRPENADWNDLQISSVRKEANREHEGLAVGQAAERAAKPAPDFLRELLIDEKLLVDGIFFLMCKENLQKILKLSYSMVGSDATARDDYSKLGSGKPHPRAFGAFPRTIREFVFQTKLLPLEEAIYKMSGLSARTFNLENRGIIKTGAFADLVVFSEEIEDRATYEAPKQYPKGIQRVYVNGTLTVLDGVHLGVKAGKVLRREKGVVH